MQLCIQKHALHFSDLSNTSHFPFRPTQNQLTVPTTVTDALSNFKGPKDNSSVILLKTYLFFPLCHSTHTMVGYFRMKNFWKDNRLQPNILVKILKHLWRKIHLPKITQCKILLRYRSGSFTSMVS